MLPLIKYPYLPAGREYLYIEAENPFMQLAKAAAQKHGCRKHATGAVAVKDGKVIATGNNAGVHVRVCPRSYKGYETGEGYRYCKEYCDQEGHAEVVLINDAKKQQQDLTGADLYLYGHWWCCQNCWDQMIQANIANVYLMQDSETLFNYEFQKDDRIEDVALSLYVSGPLTHLKNAKIKPLYEAIGALGEKLGYSAHVPHLLTDPVKNSDVSAEEVYRIDSEGVKKADVMICYVGEPSLGAGMEIELANRHKTLVILLHEEGVKVGRLVLGSPNIIDQIAFTDEADALQKLEQALNKFKDTAMQQNVSVKM